jgi:hypothetical protein
VLEMSPAASNAANFDFPIGLNTDRAIEAWYHSFVA